MLIEAEVKIDGATRWAPLMVGENSQIGAALKTLTIGEHYIEYTELGKNIYRLRREPNTPPPLPERFYRTEDPDEITVVNPDTGGAKGQKRARFDLLPARPLFDIAEHFGAGAAKYADRNWELGYHWSLSFAAIQRHLWAWWNGEDIDAETGSNHLAAAGFHILALLEYTRTHPEFDNRPNTDRSTA